MDDRRFDLLARGLGGRSRRDILRGALAALAAAVWIGVEAPGAAAACTPPGARCRRSSQCCSGHCRRRGRRRRKRCAPLPELAFGCTTDDASCDDAVVPATPCPDIPNGKCRITSRGRPVCAVPSPPDCAACQTNEDCIDEQGAGAVCIRCASCPSGSSCICPFLP